MNRNDPRIWRGLFLLLFLLNTVHFAFLILDHRMLRGHDTWQYYSTQYAFMTNAAQGGGVAWWMPYLTQGTATTWHQSWQGGLFQNVLLAAGPLFKGANFLPLFYVGLFFDELLFLVGVWLLARRFYRSPSTVFFVSAAALGSCLWADQVWHNFHAYYALPLILCWAHDFLEQGTRWKLFLAADLFLLQTLGNLPYLPILTGIALLFYGATYAVLFRRRLWDARLRPRPSDALWLLLLCAATTVLYLSLKSGTELNVIQSPRRTPDGTNRLDDFLVYGGGTNPLWYLEFLTGVSPCLDATLYCGFFVPAFAALAFLLRPDRRTLQLAAALGLMVLFSCGGLELVAPALYHLIPGMSYFRHIAFIGPFVKLFVIFLAGRGFERARHAFRTRPDAARALGLTLLLLGGCLGLLGLSSMSVLRTVMGLMIGSLTGMSYSPLVENFGILSRSLLLSAAAAAGTGICFLLAGRTRWLTPAWTAILVVHTLQVFGWKLEMLRERTLSLSPDQVALQELRPLPYVPRRSSDYTLNSRYLAFDEILWSGGAGIHGSMHWTADPYLFQDAPASQFRTTDWMAPLDELMRAYTGQPVGDRSQPLSAAGGYRLRFPLWHPAASRVIGLSVDKLQFFSEAHRLGSSQEIARYLTAPEYRGDLLFIQQRLSRSYAITPPVASSERLDAAYEVLEFDANHLRLKTRVPQKAWLLYCDVWHPGWTAEVNGKPVPVERAQIAYKAVPLEEGENVVEFRFRAPVRAACFAINSAHSLFWLLLILFVTFKCCTEKPLQPSTACYN